MKKVTHQEKGKQRYLRNVKKTHQEKDIWKGSTRRRREGRIPSKHRAGIAVGETGKKGGGGGGRFSLPFPLPFFYLLVKPHLLFTLTFTFC